MGKEFKIYTAGKMSGKTFEEQMEWRLKISEMIESRTFGVLRFIHPPLYYNYESKYHKTEQEIKGWELHQVRSSDIVIVNLDGINDSVGTHFELAVVDSVNACSDKHIFVIGIGKSDGPMHPWIQLSLHRHEENYEDAADYISGYLLV